MSMRDFLKGLYHRLPSPPSTNYWLGRPDANPFQFLPAKARILDIGSKSARGQYRFGQPPADAELVCADIAAGPGVDLVLDANDLSRLEPESADLILLVSVLQYLRDPVRFVREAQRVLRPGGALYISVPFAAPVEADPHDYYRVSYWGLRAICEEAGYEILACHFNRGPASVLVQFLISFFAIALSGKSKGLYAANHYCLSWLLFPIKYLDALLGRSPFASQIHAGAFVLARRPAAS